MRASAKVIFNFQLWFQLVHTYKVLIPIAIGTCRRLRLKTATENYLKLRGPKKLAVAVSINTSPW